ncbi:MAG: type II toxin-antitoxin system VapC family toxin [Nitrospiraceae bacterium]|nr:type II toxin-antitoxin system VapC family toxin [Nitrospiraceae bacterium]
MNRFVLDCSVVMAWCFEDEKDRYSDTVLDLLSASEAVVPSLWALEIANVLLAGERRKRLTKADSFRFINLLRELPITVDQETTDHALSETISIGREQGLSSYDATYLELAMREGIALATRDEGLRKAARKCGVKLI